MAFCLIPDWLEQARVLRRGVKTATASLLHWTGVDRLVGLLVGARSMPLVLGYHRVVDDFEVSARTSAPAMLVSRRMLEAHLDWIGRRYSFISVEDLLAYAVSGTPVDRPVAAVTFDDGYADVYENAYPLLKRKGIPAAVFLVTDLIGTSRLQVHDKLYLLLVRALRESPSAPAALIRELTDLGVRLPTDAGPRIFSHPFTAMRFCLTTMPRTTLAHLIEYLEGRVQLGQRGLESLYAMTWEMVFEMYRAGFTIGSHTKRHVLLTNESADVVVDEIAGARRDLELKLGVPIRHFAYPDGRFNPAVISAVAAAGYQLAFTTCHHRDPWHPGLTVSRRLPWEHSNVDTAGRFSPPLMSCDVSGIFDFIGCAQDHGGSAAAPTAPLLEPASAKAGQAS